MNVASASLSFFFLPRHKAFAPTLSSLNMACRSHAKLIAAHMVSSGISSPWQEMKHGITYGFKGHVKIKQTPSEHNPLAAYSSIPAQRHDFPKFYLRPIQIDGLHIHVLWSIQKLVGPKAWLGVPPNHAIYIYISCIFVFIYHVYPMCRAWLAIIYIYIYTSM